MAIFLGFFYLLIWAFFWVGDCGGSHSSLCLLVWGSIQKTDFRHIRLENLVQISAVQAFLPLFFIIIQIFRNHLARAFVLFCNRLVDCTLINIKSAIIWIRKRGSWRIEVHMR
jgi:hypothetical protein